MASLFIELYLDEDVSVLVADLLRGRRFSAITTYDEGRLGASDAELLAHAVALGRTLLAHNRSDFEALAERYRADERNHPGIILARRYPPCEFVRRVMRLLNQVTTDEIRNQVMYI